MTVHLIILFLYTAVESRNHEDNVVTIIISAVSAGIL